jgi:hypothetical protein
MARRQPEPGQQRQLKSSTPHGYRLTGNKLRGLSIDVNLPCFLLANDRDMRHCVQGHKPKREYQCGHVLLISSQGFGQARVAVANHVLVLVEFIAHGMKSSMPQPINLDCSPVSTVKETNPFTFFPLSVIFKLCKFGNAILTI